MANNYQCFSEVVSDLTPAEEEWILKQLDEEAMDDPERRGQLAWKPEDGIEFEFQIREEHDAKDDSSRRSLWIYSEDHGNPYNAAEFVRAFLKKFRLDDSWGVCYCYFSDKPRVGEFGGGAIFVTADAIEHSNAHDWLEAQRTAFTENRPAIGRLVAQVAAAGLDPAEIDELVHDAKSAEAAAINNGGADDQMAYLVATLGPSEAQQRIDGLYAKVLRR
jgi:hypothetical protein